MKKLLLTLSLAMLIAACGGSLLTSLRAALAASTPLVNSLVQSGALPQTKATAIVADFSAGVSCADALHADFKRVANDDPEKRLKKLNASVNAMRCFRAIMDRQNFAAHPRVQNAANIADGIFASLVVFYSEPGTMRASTVARSPKVARAADEKELERALKRQVDELKAALQP